MPNIIFYGTPQSTYVRTVRLLLAEANIDYNLKDIGIFNGDKRFVGSVRDQWRSVPVPWFTFSASYDQKIYGNSENGFFGFGLLFNYDRQGDSRLNLSRYCRHPYFCPYQQFRLAHQYVMY